MQKYYKGKKGFNSKKIKEQKTQAVFHNTACAKLF